MTQTAPRPSPAHNNDAPQQPRYVLTDKDKKRQAAIRAAWKAFEGELDPPLQKTPEGLDPNVLSNRVSPIVRAGVDFLFGKELEIALDAQQPGGAPAPKATPTKSSAPAKKPNTAEQQFLDGQWGDKETRIPRFMALAMNGAAAGRAFLRVVRTRSKKRPFRLVVLNPEIISVQTNDQDCDDVLLYHLEYTVEQPATPGQPAQTIAYCEEIERVDPQYNDDNDEDALAAAYDDDVTWRISHWSRVAAKGSIPQNDKWQSAGPPITWPYVFAPIFSCQNLPKPNDFWGYPDVTKDLIGLNKALNLDQSLVLMTEILYGHPLLYATGVGEGLMDMAPGYIHRLPLDTSKIASVPLPSDVPNALAFSDNLRSDMDEQSHVPGIATGRIKDMPRGNLSGVALELLFMALLKLTDTKQCLYGKLIIEVSQALLVMNGMNGDLGISLAWQSALPHDDLQAAQAGVLLLQIGISKSTVQRRMGFDPDEERMLNQIEAQQDALDYAQGVGLPPQAGQSGQASPGEAEQETQAPGGIPVQQGQGLS